MNDRPKQEWSGASGKKYTYYAFERHPEINADQIGNYIYARKNENNSWVPVAGRELSKPDKNVQALRERPGT